MRRTRKRKGGSGGIPDTVSSSEDQKPEMIDVAQEKKDDLLKPIKKSLEEISEKVEAMGELLNSENDEEVEEDGEKGDSEEETSYSFYESNKPDVDPFVNPIYKPKVKVDNAVASQQEEEPPLPKEQVPLRKEPLPLPQVGIKRAQIDLSPEKLKKGGKRKTRKMKRGKGRKSRKHHPRRKAKQTKKSRK